MKAYYVMLDYKKIDVILGGYDTNVIMNGYMTFEEIERSPDREIVYTSENAGECLEFIKKHFPQYNANNPALYADFEYETATFGRAWRQAKKANYHVCDWRLAKFTKKLNEFGLGDFIIKTKYVKNYYDPACRVSPTQYINARGYLTKYSNAIVKYYEVYDKKSGKHVSDFYHSMHFVEKLLKEQALFEKDPERFLEIKNYFWDTRF